MERIEIYILLWGTAWFGVSHLPPHLWLLLALPSSPPLTLWFGSCSLACRFLAVTGALTPPSAWACSLSVSYWASRSDLGQVSASAYVQLFKGSRGKEEGDLGIWFPWENAFLGQNWVWAERYLHYLGIPAVRNCTRSHYSATLQGDVFPYAPVPGFCCAGH